MAEQIIPVTEPAQTVAQGKPLIRLENVHKIYDLGEIQVQALRGVFLEVREGEFVAGMVPSGSGKSTGMNVLGCVIGPTNVRCYLNGGDVSGMSNMAPARVANR